jgi:hypothetical protein
LYIVATIRDANTFGTRHGHGRDYVVVPLHGRRANALYIGRPIGEY